MQETEFGMTLQNTKTFNYTIYTLYNLFLNTIIKKEAVISDGLQAGAGDGNRTHVTSLEGWSSTIELHPHNGRLF
jgi:hypothetical protein